VRLPSFLFTIAGTSHSLPFFHYIGTMGNRTFQDRTEQKSGTDVDVRSSKLHAVRADPSSSTLSSSSSSSSSSLPSSSPSGGKTPPVNPHQPRHNVEFWTEILRRHSIGQTDISLLLASNGETAMSVFKDVTIVDISGTRPTNADFIVLCKLLENKTNISELRMRGIRVKPDWTALAAVLRNQLTLKAVDVSSNDDLGNEGICALCSGLETLTTLESVNFRGTKMGVKAASILSAVLKNQLALKSVNVSNNYPLGDEGICALCSGLETLTTLESVDFSGTKMGVKAASAFSAVLKKQVALKSVNVSDNAALGDEGICALCSGLETLTTLESVNFWGTEMGVKAASAFSAVLKKQLALKSVNVSNNYPLGDEGVCALCSGLETLTTLESVDFTGTKMGVKAASAFSAVLKKQVALKSVDVSYNDALGDEGICALCSGLETLTTLESVNFWGTEMGVKAASAFSAVLKKQLALKSVNVSNNYPLGDEGICALCSGLETLTTLESVNFWATKMGVKAASAFSAVLKKQVALKSVNVRNNDALGDEGICALCSGLETLTTLESVNFTLTKMGVKAASAFSAVLKKQVALKSVNVSNNYPLGDEGVCALCSGLETLTTLESVDFTGTKMGVKAASAFSAVLKKQVALKSVDVSYNDALGDEGICALCSGLETLTTLESVNFWGTEMGVKAASAFSAVLKKQLALKSVNVTNNAALGDEGVCALCSGLETLTTLELLDFTGTKMGVRGARAIAAMVCSNTALVLIDSAVRLGELLSDRLPPEVAVLGNDEIVAYLRQVSTSSQQTFRTKLMLVGGAEVGKTSLLRCLRNVAQPETSVATDGIDIVNWEVPHPLRPSQVVSLSCWDFAGQEVYYATHQLFLSERCLYVLVWNPRVDNPKSGVDFWLKSIRTCDKEAKVILVASRKDECEDYNLPIKLDELKLQFRGMEFRSFFTSVKPECRNNEIEELRKEIARMSAALGEIDLPPSWLKLSDKILQLREKEKMFFTQELAPLGSACGIHEQEFLPAIKVLHNWGTVLRYRLKNGLADISVLDPQWLSDIARSLITSKITGIQHAVITVETLGKIWKNQVDAKHLSQMLELMHRFELAFELPDGRQLVPALLTEEPGPSDLKLIAELMDSLPCKRQHRLELSFIPANLMIRIIHRTHPFTASHGQSIHSCWKNFIVLKKESQMAKIELINSKTLQITVCGNSPNNTCSLLADLIRDLLSLYQNVNINQRIACFHCQDLWLPVSMLTKRQWTDAITCNNCDNQLSVPELLQYSGYAVIDFIPISKIEGLDSSTVSLGDMCTALRRIEQKQNETTAVISGVSTSVEMIQAGIGTIVQNFEDQISRCTAEFEDLWKGLQKTPQQDMLERLQRVTIRLLQDVDQRSCAIQKMTWQINEYHTPRILYLEPHEHTGTWGKVDPRNLIRKKYDLFLMCEQPGDPHKLEGQGPYRVEMYRELWLKLAPILVLALKVAKAVVTDKIPDAVIETLEKLSSDPLSEFPELKEEVEKLRLPQRPVERKTVALREFSQWLLEQDPVRKFQGLERVALPAGEICWLCPTHAEEARNAKVKEHVRLDDAAFVAQTEAHGTQSSHHL
jgi:GTPase SAR1 family protein/Ran GTPase-activating protein (RanGAP) involved in mRNA processing and transport